MVPFVGISYKAVVRPRLANKRCPGDDQRVLLKMVQWDSLGDPRGGSKGKKGMKIGSMNTRKNSLTLERGHTKQTGQYRMLCNTENWTKEMRSLSGCVADKRFRVGGKGQTPKEGPK